MAENERIINQIASPIVSVSGDTSIRDDKHYGEQGYTKYRNSKL